MMEKKKILVTGVAGFIGAAVSRALLLQSHSVFGIDNLNSYYDVSLKQRRLEFLQDFSDFHFVQEEIQNTEKISSIFSSFQPHWVIHLAAQAGVRFSLSHPEKYMESNLAGFLSILEACRKHSVEHLVFASSSSVYGANPSMQNQIWDRTDTPVSLYGATKKCNEVMAYSYSHLFEIPITGLRFFTVYGPWGRPDMAYFHFTQKILSGIPIEIFNQGKHSRDLTYIDDVVEGVLRVVKQPPQKGESRKSDATFPEKVQEKRDLSIPFRLYNLGSQSPIPLFVFISQLEKELQKKAIFKLVEMQAGDVKDTFASMKEFALDFDFLPKTSFEQGISQFVTWFLEEEERKKHLFQPPHAARKEAA